MRKQIYSLILTGSVLLLMTSCAKDTKEIMPLPTPAPTPAPLEANASYRMIITGTWSMPQHTVPAGNHFTNFVGMVHSPSAYIYHLGTPASLGVENVAEIGNDVALNSEMDTYINSGKALNKFSVTLPGITGSATALINLSAQHSLVSFESMIAPSPDWFAGLDSYNLVQGGKWVTDITFNIAGFDAGTEEGDVFGYTNPATNPQQNVGVLWPGNASVIANGNAVIAPFATVRFIKQ